MHSSMSMLPEASLSTIMNSTTLYSRRGSQPYLSSLTRRNLEARTAMATQRRAVVGACGEGGEGGGA